MPSSLNIFDIQKIVDLLTPLMGDENERRGLLILALGQNTPILRQLDLRGPIEPFLVKMITALVDYGEVVPGKQALWALLEVLRKRVGVDRQAKIDTLYQVINALGQNDDQGRFQQAKIKQLEYGILKILPKTQRFCMAIVIASTQLFASQISFCTLFHVVGIGQFGLGSKQKQNLKKF